MIPGVAALHVLRAARKAESLILAFSDRVQLAAQNLLDMHFEGEDCKLKDHLQEIFIQAIFSLLFKQPEPACKPLFFALLVSELMNKFALEGQAKKDSFKRLVDA